MPASQALFFSCNAFILGVGLGSFFIFDPSSLVLFFVLGVFLATTFWQEQRVAIVGLCILFLVFGVFRQQMVEIRLKRPDLEKLMEKKVVLLGQVVEEPEVQSDKVKLRVEVSEIKAKILVTTNLFPDFRYGDELKIKGALKEPPEFEGFNYKEFLKKEGIYFLMSYPEIEILERNKGSFVKSALISFKDNLRASLRRTVPILQAGFFEALLFGQEENISKEWKEKLNISGTRHIAAVSGANITIITSLIMSFLLALGFWRKHALYLSFFLIIIYVLMIGAPACAVRAAIMGGLLLASQCFGRLVDPSRLIIFALTVMLLQNPILLRYDVGFQLSFLAAAGLIYLQPFFLKTFSKIPKTLELRNSFSSTLAAQVFTLPFLLYNFGQVSLVAPVTNILILPAIPFLTIAGFLFSLFGIFSQFLGQVLSWPAYFLLTLVMEIINFFSEIPFAAKSLKISWFFLALSYLLLAVLIWYWQKREKLKFLKY